MLNDAVVMIAIIVTLNLVPAYVHGGLCVGACLTLYEQKSMLGVAIDCSWGTYLLLFESSAPDTSTPTSDSSILKMTDGKKCHQELMGWLPASVITTFTVHFCPEIITVVCLGGCLNGLCVVALSRA